MAKHEIAVNRITSNDLSNIKIGATETYEVVKHYSDFADDDLINKRTVDEALTNINPSPVEYSVPVGTQLVDYGNGYAYRIVNSYMARGVVVSSNGLVNFVPYLINDLNVDVYLPDFGMNLQRELVWTLLQKQQFIISIIKRIPVNKYAIVEIKKDEDSTKPNTYQIIDGKQRLTTVISFYRGEFPITFNGIDYYYSDLADDCLSELRSFSPRCDIAYSYDNCPVTDEMKVKWFEQLNFSGTPQDEQHMLTLKGHLI